MAKTLTGVVTSDVADKTITVTVTSRETHPIYKKQYTVSRKYAAHDENNDAHKGDTVRIVETRPVSKRKAFKLDEIVKRSVGSIEVKEEESAILIYPGTVKPGIVSTYDDHRMAMAFALLGIRAEGIVIDNCECCRKTFEDYFKVLDRVLA